jgi:methylenetetrahydrofolate dehydrogenase (NADP+)/methenyltetrahydrofolate cyclohydrolase
VAVVIDGARLAGELREKAELELAALARERVKPGLATILTGDDYAAHAYERRLRRIAGELGCRYVETSRRPICSPSSASSTPIPA